MPFSLEQFQKDYDTEIFPIKIGPKELRFHKPKSIDRFIDPDDLMRDFPLWAKIWEASAILAQYLADLPLVAKRRILELGSGLGVSGITAAAQGHDITLTEYDPDALNFLRANVEVNQCARAAVRRLDWFNPDIEGRFDLIIGSEIVYQHNAVDALGKLFHKYLRPRGKVLITERVRATGAVFFEKMASRFDIRAQKHTLRSNDKLETVVLFELTLK
jgi:predicted nicotinamide N-methyase